MLGSENIKISNSNIEFQEQDEIYFPKVCVICGVMTDNKIKEAVFGSFTSSSEYKYDYLLDVPVCNECEKRLKIKSGLSSKTGLITLFSIIAGIILSMVLFFIAYSILFSIALLAAFVLFPLFYHLSKVRKKIKLDKHLKMDTKRTHNAITFQFSNENYANVIRDLNPIRLNEKDKSTSRVDDTEEADSFEICKKCGTKFKAKYSFCTNCGAPINK